jgi:aromatic ring-opening dioxygenase catalytic subunit (LigB family)
MAPAQDNHKLINPPKVSTRNIFERRDERLSQNQKITGGSQEELIDYRRRAPHSELAHPTEEHLLPLFVAMGAGTSDDEKRGHSLHRGWTYGSLSMAAYSFGDDK